MTTATLSAPEVAPPVAPGPSGRVGAAEVAVAVGAFALFCVVALTKATKLLEPDDAAYLGSIIALSHGHISLTTAQYDALSSQMRAQYGTTIAQWVHLSNGRWMSEKNPGYPFYAVVFYWLGILRAAPLFAGGLASVGLFAGARRWLGRWGGTWAVILFLSSGAALAFAWRPTMPSFTDASLAAAGAGALLWTLLAVDAPARRRTVVGLLGFGSLEAAVFIRYTDVAILGVAVLAVLVCCRRSRVPARSLGWWLGTLVLFGALVMAFDHAFYGGVLTTGYRAGEITFAASAIVPNLKTMPSQLVRAIPALLLGLGAVGWMAVRIVRSRRSPTDPATATSARRDAVVGLFLAAGWFAIWGLYAAYTWTAQQGPNPGGGPGGHGGGGIHVIRFYLPAIGLIALLGAWLLVQLPKWLPPLLLAAVAGLGLWSFESLTAVGAVGPLGGGGFPGAGPGGAGGGLPPPGARLPKGARLPPGGGPGGYGPGGGRPPSGFTPAKGAPPGGG